MDLRELLRELHGQPLARRGELVLLHDPAPDRVALEPRHRERLAAGEIRQIPVRPRSLHACLVRRLDHGVLLRERQRVVVHHGRRRTTHD